MHDSSTTPPPARHDLGRASLEHLLARARDVERTMRDYLDGEIPADERDVAAARARSYRLGRADTCAIVQAWIVSEINDLEFAIEATP